MSDEQRTSPCPDCGGVVSHLAAACPHCGRPTDVPAGWYPDPNDSSRKRYWDGTEWITQPSSAPQVQQLEAKASKPVPGKQENNKGLFRPDAVEKFIIKSELFVFYMVILHPFLFQNFGGSLDHA